MKKIAIVSIAVLMVVILSGCVGQQPAGTPTATPTAMTPAGTTTAEKTTAPAATTEVEKPTSTPRTAGEAKIVPWRLPPVGEDVIIKSGGTSGSQFTGRDLSDAGVLRKQESKSWKNITWLDEKGNVLYYEKTTISYEPLEGSYGYGIVEAMSKTVTFSWKGESSDRKSLFGPNPIFSPSIVVFKSVNNSYYSYVTIENKGGAGDVTLIVYANVAETKENYIISKVFRMDKEEKVKAIVYFPENFPQDTLVYTSSYAQTSKAVSGVSFEVRPSLWKDASQGAIEIDRDHPSFSVKDEKVIAKGSNPAWSPDGTKIVFVSYDNESVNLWIMDADGTNKKQLTSDGAWYSHPSWSYNGKNIAFISSRYGDAADIWVMDTDGRNKVQLTSDIAKDYVYPQSWSPDGKKIVFTSYRSGNSDIWVMDNDGSNKKQLTASTAWDGRPAWSPDGNKIAFTSERSGNKDIWVMDSDGSNQKQLTMNSAEDNYPSWNQDGTKIAFVSSNRDNWGIYVMNQDGTNQKWLLPTSSAISSLSWGPGGKKFLFEEGKIDVGKGQIPDIYVMTFEN